LGWGCRSKGAAAVALTNRLPFPLAPKTNLPDENLVFEGHALGIVFLKPPSAASESENTLTWSTSPTCLPGHVVLGRFHHTPLAPHAHIGKECPAVTVR
jgi:hypothetical protein